MGKWLIGFMVLLLLSFLVLIGCQKRIEPQKSNRVQVYTSIYPLQDLAQKIGGQSVQVTNMIPPGTEPHDFELTARSMAKLSEADVFVYNGAGLESWVGRVTQTLDPDKTVIVDSTKGLNLLMSGQAEETHGRVDPHVWLDPLLAKEQALKIKDALVKVDPKHRNEYESNVQVLMRKLTELDQEYQEMVEKAEKKEFVVSHAAFGYLAHWYGLKQIAVTGMTPVQEPSPKELKNLIEQVKKYQVKYILFETLVSGKIAEVVRNEVKAEALSLNPLEGLTKEEVARKEDYFSVMRKNKENLAKALGAVK